MSETNFRFVYLRDSNKTPVGCLSYTDLSNDSFAFGVSFLNPGVDVVDKARAREIARARCQLAVTGHQRLHCQGRFGKFTVTGRHLSEKLADLLQKVAINSNLHGQPKVRERMTTDLMLAAKRLRGRKSEAA